MPHHRPTTASTPEPAPLGIGQPPWETTRTHHTPSRSTPSHAGGVRDAAIEVSPRHMTRGAEYLLYAKRHPDHVAINEHHPSTRTVLVSMYCFLAMLFTVSWILFSFSRSPCVHYSSNSCSSDDEESLLSSSSTSLKENKSSSAVAHSTSDPFDPATKTRPPSTWTSLPKLS